MSEAPENYMRTVYQGMVNGLDRVSDEIQDALTGIESVENQGVEAQIVALRKAVATLSIQNVRIAGAAMALIEAYVSQFDE